VGLLVLALTLSALTASLLPAQAPVYAMEEVYAGLHQDPQAWEGRTVLLRATVVGNVSYRLCRVNPRTILPGHPPRCPDIDWMYLGPTTWRQNGVMGLYGLVINDGWTMHPWPTLTGWPGASVPAQEIHVQIHASFYQWHKPDQPLPTVLYQIPLVGSLLPRAPSLLDPVKVWRVRLLTPRACLALRQTACPDGVSLDY